MMTRLFSTRFSLKSIVFLIFFSGFPCALLAQANHASWSDLSGLQPGQRIQVVGMTAKKHSGSFVNISDTAISYLERNGQQSIPKQDVLSVKLMEHKHRLRNTLIVAAVGAGVGAGIGAAAHKRCSAPSFCLDVGGTALPAGVGAVLGGLGGAVVGILLPSHSTIYQMSSQ